MLAMAYSEFSKAKGSLPYPIQGKIVGRFGKAFDPESKLQIFKKGIEIAAASDAAVKAVYPGKIAYSGELQNYGRVVIVDHGDHFYTLCARLGSLKKNAGDEVRVGDSIGTSDGHPVYFEIRAKNIPVDPLAWVAKTN
jgi:septal ring factor EnvC (AmiA/AmiB activator)